MENIHAIDEVVPRAWQVDIWICLKNKATYFESGGTYPPAAVTFDYTNQGNYEHEKHNVKLLGLRKWVTEKL